jgi:hypothetical protein
VISADPRIAAQRRTGDVIRFDAIGVEEGEHITRERPVQLASLGRLAFPVRDGLPPPEELLGLNLAGAVVVALSLES